MKTLHLLTVAVGIAVFGASLYIFYNSQERYTVNIIGAITHYCDTRDPAKFVGVSGFSDIVSSNMGNYEFVLKPGSTGHISMIYVFYPEVMYYGSVEKNYSTVDEILKLHRINVNQFFNRDVQRVLLVGNHLGPTAHGVYLNDTTTYYNDTSVKVDFVIKANPDASKGPFAITIPGCPYQILTVGNVPYNGTFYDETYH